MKLYHCTNSNLCLIKENGLYILSVYDEARGRSIVWRADKHRALTEFMDKLFK